MKLENIHCFKNNEHRQMFKKVVVVVVCASSRHHLFPFPISVFPFFMIS